MKSEYVFKHIKLVLWGIAVAFMAQIIFTAHAYAQSTDQTSDSGGATSADTMTFDERIEMLSRTLETTSDAIENSTTLTDDQKRGLFVQLIELSRSILGLRTASLEQQAQSLPANAPVAGQQTLEDVGIHKVQIDYDYDTAEAVVTQYLETPESIAAGDDIEELLEIEYDTDVQTMTMTPSAGVSNNYGSIIADVRRQIIDQLVLDKNVNKNELAEVVFLSSRHPARGPESAPNFFAENSQQAIDLSEQFGESSVIKNVKVMPGARIGRILFESDQGEILELTLTRSDLGQNTGDRNSNSRVRQVAYNGGVTYQLETAMYYTDVPSLLRWYDCNGARDCVHPRPARLVSEKDNPGTRTESVDFINELFAEIPFTSSLRDANEDFLSFIVENPAYYQGSQRATYANTPLDVTACVDPVDELVMSEYVLQVMSGVQVNYVLQPDLIEYVLPVVADDTGSIGCRNVQEFF